MKKRNLISHVAITSLVAMAFSAAASSSSAAELIWNGGASGTINSNAWVDRDTGVAGVNFSIGDNLWFQSGLGSIAISNASSGDYTGKLTISAGSGDVYTFTGQKLYFNGDVNVTTVTGSSVIFGSLGKGEGVDNNDLDITVNLNGTGTVYFKESTSAFAGKGRVIVGEGTTLIAGDDTAADPGTDAGGITKSRVYNYGTIEFWRGGTENTLTGADSLRNNQIIGMSGAWDGKIGDASLGSMGVFEKYRDNVLVFDDNNSVQNTIIKLYEGTIKVGSRDTNPAGVWGKGDLSYTRFAGASVRLMLADDTVLKVKHDQAVAWLDTSLTSGTPNSGSGIIITGSDEEREGLLHVVYPSLSDFTGVTFQNNGTHKLVMAYGIDGPHFAQAFTLGGDHTYTGPTFVLGDTTIKITSSTALGAEAVTGNAGSELWLLKGSKIDLNGVSISKHLGLWGEENFSSVERPVYWRENAVITNTSATLATITIPSLNENAPRYYQIEGNVRLEVTSGSYRIGVFTEGGKDPWGNPFYGVRKNTYTGGSYFGPEVGFLQLDTAQDPFGTGDVEWNGKHLNVRVPGVTIHGILYMNSKGRNDGGYSHHRIDLEGWHGAQLIVNGVGGKLHRELEIHNRGEFVLDGDYSKYTWVIGHQNDDAQTPYSTYTSDDKNYLNKGYVRMNAARLTVDDGRKLPQSAIKLSADDPDGTIYWAPIRLEGGFAYLNVVGDMTGVKALMNPLSFLYEDSKIRVQEGFTLEAKGQIFAEGLNNGREKGFYKTGLGKMIIAGQFGGKFGDLNTQEREQLSELRVMEGTLEFAPTATFLHKNNARMWYIVAANAVLDVSSLGLNAAGGKFENSGKMIGDINVIAGDTGAVWMNELDGSLGISGGRTLNYANKITGNFTADAAETTISQIGSVGGNMTVSNGVVWNLKAEDNNTVVTGTANISDSTIKLTSLHLLKSGDVLFPAGTGSTFSNITIEGLAVGQSATGLSLSGGNVVINLTNTLKEVAWDGTTIDWNTTGTTWDGAAYTAKSIVTFGSGKGIKTVALSEAINASDIRVETLITDDYTIGGLSSLLTVDYAVGVSGAGKVSLVNTKTKNLTVRGTAQLTTNGNIVDDEGSTVLVKGGTWMVSGTTRNNPEIFANLILDSGTVKGTAISATNVEVRSGILDIDFANSPTITKTTSNELKLGGHSGSGRINLQAGKVTMTSANVGGGKTVLFMSPNTVLDINGFDQDFHIIGASGAREYYEAENNAKIVNNSDTDATVTIQRNTSDPWELARFVSYSDGTGTGKLSLSFIGQLGNVGVDRYLDIELGTNYYTGDTYIGNHGAVKFYETRPFGSGGTVNIEIGQNYTQLLLLNSGDFHADKAHKEYEIDNNIHFVNKGISSTDPVFNHAKYEGNNHLSSQYIAGFWTEQWVTTTITGNVTGDVVKLYFRGSGSEEDRIVIMGDFDLDSERGVVFIENTFVSFGHISGFKEVLRLEGGGSYRYTGVEFREDASLNTDIWITSNPTISIFPGKTVVLKGNISQRQESETNGWGEYWNRWVELYYGGTLVLASSAPNPILNNAAGIKTIEDGDFNPTTIQLGDGLTPGIGYFPGDIQLNAGDSVLVFNRPEDYSLIDVGGKRGRESDNGGALFNQNVKIEGKGSVVKKGAGMLTLVRDHSYQGETVIEEGSLRLASMAVMPEATREMAMATSKYVINTGTKLIFDLDQYTLNNGIFYVEAGVTGDGSFEQWSGNTQFVSVGYKGDTLVKKGTVTVLGGNFVSSSITIGDGAMLDLKGRPVYTNSFSSAGSFGGSLNLSGAGKLTGGLGNVDGNVALTNVGTIAVNTSSVIGATSITGTASISGTNDIIFRLSGESGVGIADSVAIEKTLTASGTNTIKLSVLGELVNGDYTLFSYATSTIPAFAMDATGYRVGDLVLTQNATSVVLNVNVTAHDLIWEGASVAWDTSAANWEDNSVSAQKFYTADNVTFDATGAANKAVTIAAGGVAAGDMLISVDGYSFTGGNISAKSLELATGTAMLNNDNLSVADSITVGSGAKLNLGLVKDVTLSADLIGLGDFEKSGTNKLVLQSDNTAFEGKLIVTNGILDISGHDYASVELNGGILQSTVDVSTRMNGDIKVTANNSVIDLGNVIWVGGLSGTNLHDLTLKSEKLGLFQNTAIDDPTYFDNGSTIANFPTTLIGEVAEITTLNLENVEFNRPIKPNGGSAVINVTGKESELGTYAHIDLSSDATLTMNIDSGTNVAAWNFLMGDGTFVKKGKGTLDFGDVKGGGKTFESMNFSGTILVEEGLLNVTRSGVDVDGNSLFDGVDGRVTVVVKGGATLKGRLGDGNTNKTPLYKLEGSQLGGEATWRLVSQYTYVKDLELTKGRVTGYKLGVMFNSEGSADPVTSTFKVFSEGSVDTVSYIDSTLKLSFGDLNIVTADEHSILQINGDLERNKEDAYGSNSTSYTLRISGPGKVILSGGTSSFGDDGMDDKVIIESGATLQAGTGAVSGGITNASILNSGTIIDYRNDDHEYNNVISGTGQFIKKTGQVLTINGLNTYTGKTTIESGSIKIGANGGIDSSVGGIEIQSAGKLDLTNFGGDKGGYTSVAAISNAGSITGTLNIGKSLSNTAAALTEKVNINSGGTLLGNYVGGTSGSATALQNGGTILVGAAGTAASNEIMAVNSTLSLDGGQFTLDVNNSTGDSDRIVLNGALSFAGANKTFLNLVNHNVASTTGADGTYTIMEGVGINTFTAAALKGYFSLGRATLDFSGSNANQIIVSITGSASMDLIWNGTTGSVWSNNIDSHKSWKDAANPAAEQTWFVNNDRVTFGTEGAKTVSVHASGVSAEKVKVDGAAYTFDGTGGITVTDASGLVIAVNSSVTLKNSGINNFGKVDLQDATSALILGDNQSTAGYAIEGSGRLEKIGTGTLTLNSANTYSGGTTLTGGTVVVNAANNLGTGIITFNGGNLSATNLDLSAVDSKITSAGGTITAGGSVADVVKVKLGETAGDINGALTKAGTGTLELTNVNYVAKKKITVNEGTLKAEGASFVDLNGAGNIDVGSHELKVQGGHFSGTWNAGVTKLVVDAVDNLSSAHTFVYTGGNIGVSTVIGESHTLEGNLVLGSGKTLAAGNSIGTSTASIKGNVTLTSGSTLIVASSDVPAMDMLSELVITGDMSLSGTTLKTTVDFVSTQTDIIRVSGKVSLDTVDKTVVDLSSDGSFGSHAYTLIQYGTLDGVTADNVGDAFVVAGISRKDLAFSTENQKVSFVVNANAATLEWNGNASSIWNTGAASGTPAGDDNWTYISGGSYIPGFFVGGDNVTFGDIGGGGTITVDTTNGPIAAGVMRVNSDAGQDYTFAGSALTAEQLIKEGTSELIFNSAGNTFTDLFRIKDGSVTLGVNGALAASTKVSFDTAATANATFNVNGKTQAIASLSGVTGHSNVALGTGGELTVGSGNYTGKITGDSTSKINKDGTGVLVLGGLNTTDFQGVLNAKAGTLELVGANQVTTLNSDSGAIIRLSGSGSSLTIHDGLLNGNMTGAGNVTTKGNVTLNGNNTFAGTLSIDNGSMVVLGNVNALTSSVNVSIQSGGTLDLNGNSVNAGSFNAATGSTVALSNNAQLTANSASNSSFDGTLTGTGSLVKDGSGTLVLTANNTYSGGTTIKGGTLEVSASANLGSNSTVTIQNGGVLSLTTGYGASGHNLNLAGGQGVIKAASGVSASFADLSGTGTLIKDGAGTLNLTGNVGSFTGAITINDGKLSSANSLTVTGLNGSGGKLDLVSDFTVNNNATNNFGGGLEGSGNFVKQGSSSLSIGGDSTGYSGNVSIEKGRLAINGNFGSGSNTIIVKDGAILGGNGIINADIIAESGGKIAPGNSADTITVNGNVTMNSGSLLSIEISNVADGVLSGILKSDRLVVNGTLALDDVSLDVIRESSSDTSFGDDLKYLILQGTSLAGGVSELLLDTSDNFLKDDYKLSLFQENNDIYLIVKLLRPDYSQYVDGENQSNVAVYLDSGWDNANTFWKKTVTKEVRANAGQASAFLDQLSGYSLAHATQSRELAGEHFRQLWSQRLMTGIAAQPSLDKSTVNINPTEAMSMAKFKDAESEMKESYWAQPFTYDTSMKSENHVKGYDYRSNGVTAGFDTRFDTGMVIGGAFFYEDGNIETKRSSDKTNINDARFAVYGGWDEEDVSLIASANYGIQQYESKRYVNIGDLGGRNKADYDGNTYGVSIDGAVRITKQMRVFAGFDWLNVSRDSFHEKGSDFAMDVSKETHDMLASRLGVRYDRYFGSFGVYGLVAWRHRFDDTASDLKGSYDGTPGSFKSNGLSNDPDSALLGLGGEYNVTPNYSIFADVNADLNTDHTELGLSAGLRYTW